MRRWDGPVAVTRFHRQAPSGVAQGSVRSARPETRVWLDKASVRHAFHRGDLVTYRGVVRVTGTGLAQIRARATGAYAGPRGDPTTSSRAPSYCGSPGGGSWTSRSGSTEATPATLS